MTSGNELFNLCPNLICVCVLNQWKHKQQSVNVLTVCISDSTYRTLCQDRWLSAVCKEVVVSARSCICVALYVCACVCVFVCLV